MAALSFKTFCQFLDESQGKSPEQIDEIFGKFFNKNKDKSKDTEEEDGEEEDDKDNKNPKASKKPVDPRKEFLLKKQTELEKKRDVEKERRNALRKQAEEKWAEAKKRAESTNKQTQKIGDKDDYAMHRAFA